MNVTDVNSVLAFLVICGAALALAALVSPRALDWVAMRAHARSCALRASRNSYRETYKLAVTTGIVWPPAGK